MRAKPCPHVSAVPTFDPDAARAARGLAGLPQRTAARRLKISQSYLSLIEAGARRPSAPLIERMVRLYARHTS
jgi:transcriptional regulator with XRE-family HTH domain